MFQLIDKCYKNSKFPNSNITVIDKLYKSLPSDFVDSKCFVSLLEEVNQIIWPDSSINKFVNVEHIYDQLVQYKSSMKVLFTYYSIIIIILPSSCESINYNC